MSMKNAFFGIAMLGIFSYKSNIKFNLFHFEN